MAHRMECVWKLLCMRQVKIKPLGKQNTTRKHVIHTMELVPLVTRCGGILRDTIKTTWSSGTTGLLLRIWFYSFPQLKWTNKRSDGITDIIHLICFCTYADEKRIVSQSCLFISACSSSSTIWPVWINLRGAGGSIGYKYHRFCRLSASVRSLPFPSDVFAYQFSLFCRLTL